MSKIISLTKVMLKNTSTGLESGKKKETKYKKGIAYLGVLVLIVVLSISFYFMSKELLLSLQAAGFESLAIQLVVLGLSAYLFVISVISVPMVFYFSKDIEHLLSLPLKPFEILSAKTLTSYVNLLISTVFIVIPFGIAYQFIIEPPLIFMFFYILVILILPMIPLALSITITILLFTFIPKVNNKDFFTYFTSFLMFFFIFVINFSTTNTSDLTGNFLLANLGFINQVPKLIPSIGLLIHALAYFDLLALLGALAFSLVLVWASLKLIGNLYFKGALGAQETTSKKKKRKKHKRSKKSDSKVVALMKIDIKTILKTPSLAINYLLPIIVLPLFMFLPLVFSINPEDLAMIKEVLHIAQDFIKQLDSLSMIPFLIFISFIATYAMSAFTTITSTSISREGENMKIFKSLPISLMTVVDSKILLGMIVSGIFPAFIAIVVSLALRLNIIAVIIIFASMFVALAFGNTSDIILDLIKPKLEWDDQIQAVKQNFVSVIPIFVSFGVLALDVFIFLKFNTLYSSLLIVGFSAVLTMFNYKVLIPKYAINKLNQAIQKL